MSHLKVTLCVRHPKYLGTAPMNLLTQVIRTSEYQWNYNWVRRRKLNLLRILKILRNWGKQSWRFLFSRWLWRICSLIVIGATEQTLLKRGCNNICGWSKILVRISGIIILIVVVRFIKKYLKDKKKCEEGNWKCNMENVPKINIWNLNTKYHKTIDHTKCHMKIHTMENPYHCCVCAQISIPRSHMKSHARENQNPYAQCGREVISRNHSKRHGKRIIE